MSVRGASGTEDTGRGAPPGTTLIGVGEILRRCRLRIPAETAVLGFFERQSRTIGRHVTQEEVAEAVGVSREWYAMIETGRARRISMELLDQLADALMMDPQERTALLARAVPAIERAFPSPEATAAHHLNSLRGIVRRIWAASSECEILQFILDELTSRFRGTQIGVGLRRPVGGGWIYPGEFASGPLRQRMYDIAAGIEHLKPADQEQIRFIGVIDQPGETKRWHTSMPGTRPTRLFVEHMKKQGLKEYDAIFTHVRSTGGFQANLSFLRPEEYSESEIAILGVVAEIASLAISSSKSP